MIKFLAALVVAAGLFLGGQITDTSHAWTPPNPRILAQGELSPHIRGFAKGQVYYEISDEYGWSAWKANVNGALDTNSWYAQSYGNIMSPHLYVAENPSRARIKQRLVSTAFMQANCGGSSVVIGCAYWYNNPAFILYKGAALSQWAFRSVASVIEHENHHVISVANDQYYQPTLTCTGNPDTVMDCGSTAAWLQPYDIQTLFYVYVPDHPKITNVRLEGGWVNVSWDLLRKDGGYAHYNNDNDIATRVAFAFSRQGELPSWVGQLGCGADYGYCFTEPKALQRGFDIYWVNNFDCAWVRMENSFWSVEQSSQLGLDGGAPAGHWALSGCWR